MELKQFNKEIKEQSFYFKVKVESASNFCFLKCLNTLFKFDINYKYLNKIFDDLFLQKYIFICLHTTIEF